jgi:heme/copper-type cytochrome/quinol oxidase subunit 4
VHEIFGFAFIQAAVQLLMFMHLTEGKDGQVQSFKVIMFVYRVTKTANNVKTIEAIKPTVCFTIVFIRYTLASIVLTLLAVFVTLYTNMTFHAKTTIIFGFAFIQH